MGTSNEEVTAFLAEWTRAEQGGDTAVLDRRLVGDFLGVGPLGFILSKQDWLERYARGLHYDAFSLDDAQVRVYGDTAVSSANRTSRAPTEAIRFRLARSARRSYSSTSRASGGWRAAT